MFQSLFTTDEVTDIVTLQVIKLLNAPVTSQTAIATLKNHPHYPSFASISDSFSQWKIDNGAFNASLDELRSYPLPLIAFVSEKTKEFVVVTAINETYVTILDEKSKPRIINKNEFEKIYKGIVMAFERSEISGDVNFLENKKRERTNKAKLLGIFSLAMALAIFSSFGIAEISESQSGILGSSLLFCSLLAGCIVTGLLLLYQVDRNNKLVKKLCSAAKKTNCNAVLDSSHAEIFPGLTLSEVGFFYFTGNFLVLMLASASSTLKFDLIGYSVALSYLSLLFIPYSIYYQWRVIKEWCPLCLVTLGILIVNASLIWSLNFSTSLDTFFSFKVESIIAILFCLSIPIVIWYSLKRKISSYLELKSVARKYQAMKFRTEVFEAILNTGRQVKIPPSSLGISLGAEDPKMTIIKVCSPYCPPCAKSHPEIDAILASHPDKVRVQTVFAVSTDQSHYTTQPAVLLLKIAKHGNQSILRTALAEWYGSKEKSFELFKKNYSNYDTLDWDESQLADMDRWCSAAGVTATPTYFINGKQLTPNYKMSEINYLLGLMNV